MLELLLRFQKILATFFSTLSSNVSNHKRLTDFNFKVGRMPVPSYRTAFLGRVAGIFKKFDFKSNEGDAKTI